MNKALLVLALTGCVHAPHTELMGAVHESITYVPDQRQYKKHQFLERGCPALADCEEYVFCMQQKLAEQSIASNAVYCQQWNGVRHMVLQAGGWVYDPTFNRATKTYPCEPLKVMTWEELKVHDDD